MFIAQITMRALSSFLRKNLYRSLFSEDNTAAKTNYSRRIAGNHRPCSNILKGACSGPNNCAFLHSNTRTNKSVSGDPDMISKSDWRRDQLHVGGVNVMTCCAKKTVLTHSRVRTDPYGGHRVAVDLRPEARIVSHFKVPRSPDPYRWMHHDASTNTSAKGAQ